MNLPSPFLLLAGYLCASPFSPAQEGDPAAALLARFVDHDIVLLGESPHQGRRIHEFISSLVRQPTFAERVDDVVVEFGNARHQATMDRYLLDLESIPQERLALAWRDTTQLLVWDSPVYEQFFSLVRSLNSTLESSDRVRVLLGDPAIDWSQVHTPLELDPWMDRERSYFEILEREVLDRDRKALVLIGKSHCMERTPRDDFAEEPTHNSWLGHLLHAHHPGRSTTVYSFFDKATLTDYEDASTWEAPTWIDLATNPIGEASFGLIGPKLGVQREIDGETMWVPLENHRWPAMKVMVDALLYLGEGKDDEVPPLPATYEEKPYAKELLRRAKLLDELFEFDYYVPSLVELLPKGGN